MGFEELILKYWGSAAGAIAVIAAGAYMLDLIRTLRKRNDALSDQITAIYKRVDQDKNVFIQKYTDVLNAIAMCKSVREKAVRDEFVPRELWEERTHALDAALKGINDAINCIEEKFENFRADIMAALQNGFKHNSRRKG